jgi:N-acyl-D-aspartate/D-glutamate deacylase
MTYDVKITGGRIVAGDGSAPAPGDVAVKDGRIVAVGDCPESAARVIDAQGAIITPGFIDLHTHYDGQVSWDEELRPSVNFGVTTARSSRAEWPPNSTKKFATNTAYENI